MTDADAKSLFKRACKVARLMGITNDPDIDEIAQDVVEAFIKQDKERPGSKRRLINQAVIDSIRSRRGRLDKYKESTKDARESIRLAVSIIDDLDELPAYHGDDPDIHRWGWSSGARGLKGMGRIVIYLSFYWGFTGVEIAEVCGVTSASVTHHMDEAIGRCRKKAEATQ